MNETTLPSSVYARLSSRKFIIVCYVLITNSIFRCLDYIDIDTYKTIVISVLTIYISGNVIQKYTEKKTT